MTHKMSSVSMQITVTESRNFKSVLQSPEISNRSGMYNLKLNLNLSVNSFHFPFTGAVIDGKLQQGNNASMFLHQPNWKEVCRDIVSIRDGIADTSHSNGVACEWAAALQRLALIYVQQAATVTYTGGRAVQKEVKLSGITMEVN